MLFKNARDISTKIIHVREITFPSNFREKIFPEKSFFREKIFREKKCTRNRPLVGHNLFPQSGLKTMTSGQIMFHVNIFGVLHDHASAALS
jgi:hypothetical protein